MKNIYFRQKDQNSVEITWPGIWDAKDSKILTAYLIHYESYPNHLCHRGFVRSDIMVKNNIFQNVVLLRVYLVT